MKDKDQIAELFKQGLDGYQAKVDPALWSSIQSGIGTAATTSTATAAATSSLSIGKIVIGAVAAIAATTATVFIVVNTEAEEDKTANNDNQIEQQVVANESDSTHIDDTNELEEDTMKPVLIAHENLDTIKQTTANIDANNLSDIQQVQSEPVQNREDESKSSPSNTENNSVNSNIYETNETMNNPVVSNQHSRIENDNSENIEETEVTPERTLTVDIQKEQISNQHFRLFASTLEGATVNWDFGDGYFSKGAEVEHIFNEPGDYVVYVTVSKDKQVVGERLEIKVPAVGTIDHLPNVFSPGRDGINDELFITASHIKDFQITVFDSKNKVIFKSNDVNFRWNGIDERSGLLATPGNYYYIITANDEQGNSINKFQHLTIRY